MAKPLGGDVVGDERQRLLVSFGSTCPSGGLAVRRRTGRGDERVRHPPRLQETKVETRIIQLGRKKHQRNK